MVKAAKAMTAICWTGLEELGDDNVIPSANAINKGFASDTAKPSYAPHGRIEPVHLAITLNATEAALRAKTIRAQVALTLRVPKSSIGSIVSIADRKLVLNATALDIHTVTGSDDWSYDGESITLIWTTGCTDNTVVTIDYTIATPISGIYFSVPDARLPTRALHAITDHESERARYWLPSVDFPLVRTTLEFSITHSTHHVCVANGKHISTTVAGAAESGDVTTVYRLANHTCPSYLICWAVGDFVTFDDGDVDGMPIQYLCSRDSERVTPEALKLTFGKTGEIVRWLQNKVGLKFPWEKYYQIITPKIEGGAMENISLVTYRENFLVDEELVKDGYGIAVDGTNVHEMAHTYFGDLLTIRHFEHVWLKESWATFVDACWREDHYSHEDARYAHFCNAERYIEETKRYVRPIVCRTYDASWDLFDSHTYPGGAYRIHMLRFILGDDTFWAAVKNYVNKFNGKYVETEDFKRCLEQESGLNLTKFFDQWLYGKGFPKLKAEYSFDSDKKIVQISLEQTQFDKDLDIPAVFEITVEVDIIDSEGKVHNTQVVFSDATGPRGVVFVVLSGDVKPEIVEIDPRGKVLHSLEFNPGEAILEATAKRARDVGSRNGSIGAFKKAASALKEETHFGVRSQVYAALSESKLQPAVDILANSLNTETNPRCFPILTSLCTFKDERIRAGLKALLTEKKDLLTGRSRRSIYLNIGRQRHPEDAEFLIAARLAHPANFDLHNLTLEGIVQGLGHHRSPAALKHLLDLVFTASDDSGITRKGVPDAISQAAVAAIGNATVWVDSKVQRKEIAEKLAELVRTDDAHRLRQSAIYALLRIGEEGKPYLNVAEAVAKTAFPKADSLSLVKDIKNSKSSGADVADLKKTVEDLETRLKKMEVLVQLFEAKEKSGFFVDEGKKSE
ncbi:hypothetical protein HK100_001041 [Physocladia obscura]|uniref:Aminopeptidase n=1 Tax=Physocladia obscura TaxID=109957 RepID=A0AAD5XET0_9FUNG|nr:hypothetical protein HK100_001041 [Physocladia obscura]